MQPSAVIDGATHDVVVVHERDASRELFVRQLALGGLRVTGVTDVVDAVSLFVARRPAVIVLSFEMPGAARALRVLKADPRASAVSVIVVTHAEAFVEAYAAGADVVLHEPIVPSTLTDVVIALNERHLAVRVAARRSRGVGVRAPGPRS